MGKLSDKPIAPLTKELNAWALSAGEVAPLSRVPPVAPEAEKLASTFVWHI